MDVKMRPHHEKDKKSPHHKEDERSPHHEKDERSLQEKDSLFCHVSGGTIYMKLIKGYSFS